MIGETDAREQRMAQRIGTRLEEFFEERTDGYLRSIINYEDREYEIVYLREDVAEEYTEEELREAVDESIMDSLAAPVYGHVFSEDHGELTCLVQCFANVIEMNFVLADGVGTAVALDVEAMGEATGMVADARQIVLEER